MDTLRLIILFIGLLLIAGVYLWYREPKTHANEIPPDEHPSFLTRLKALFFRHHTKHRGQDNRIGPPISIEDVESIGTIKVHGGELTEDELVGEVRVGWDSMTPVASKDELLIVLTVLARPGQKFSGRLLRQAARQTGFEYGDMQIFHCRVPGRPGNAPPVCSFANLLKPGHFARIDSEGFETPGISLFCQLPGPLEAREAFRLTLSRAQALAELLDGEVCDETRSILTEQTISHLKEKVEAFRFKQKMAAMQQHKKER